MKEVVIHNDEVQCLHCWNGFSITWEELLEERGVDWQEAFSYIWACPICNKPTYITNEEDDDGEIEIEAIERNEWFSAGYMGMYEGQVGK